MNTTTTALHSPHRFKIGQLIYDRKAEEVYKVRQLTAYNGWAAYYVDEYTAIVFDVDCIPSSLNKAS